MITQFIRPHILQITAEKEAAIIADSGIQEYFNELSTLYNSEDAVLSLHALLDQGVLEMLAPIPLVVVSAEKLNVMRKRSGEDLIKADTFSSVGMCGNEYVMEIYIDQIEGRQRSANNADDAYPIVDVILVTALIETSITIRMLITGVLTQEDDGGVVYFEDERYDVDIPNTGMYSHLLGQPWEVATKLTAAGIMFSEYDVIPSDDIANAILHYVTSGWHKVSYNTDKNGCLAVSAFTLEKGIPVPDVKEYVETVFSCDLELLDL